MKAFATFAVLCILSPLALFGQAVYNRTTGVSYASLSACLGALADGGSNTLIEIDGPVSGTATFNKSYSNLTIRGVNQPTIDIGGVDTWISFNGTSKTLTGITIDNFRLINNNTATASAAALRFTTVGGSNYLQRITFNNCSVPVRATTNCGAFTVEDCIARGYTLGVFRFGLGPTTGVNPNTADMGDMTFRRCKFYADANGAAESDLVIKRMSGLLVEDCEFNTASKYAIDIFDPAFTSGIGTIRRNTFVNGHAKATSGGTVNVAPNTTTGTGTTQSIILESNIFAGDKGTAYTQINGTGGAIQNNTFLEGSGASVAMVLYTTSKNLSAHVNNIYVANSTNTNPMLNIGSMVYDAGAFTSDYNLYYKTNARSLIQGTTTGASSVTVTAATLPALQAKGYDTHGVNTQPVFNTTQPKFSSYYLMPTSPGVNVGNTAFIQSRSHVFGVAAYATQDIGRLTTRNRRYRTGRSRIIKTN